MRLCCLVLQPLVENAVKRGIAPHVGRVESPLAHTVKASLVMTVSDEAERTSVHGRALDRDQRVEHAGAPPAPVQYPRFGSRHRDGFTVLVAIR